MTALQRNGVMDLEKFGENKHPLSPIEELQLVKFGLCNELAELSPQSQSIDNRLLETDFESTSIPIVFKMLDRGCAWIDGQSCGFDVPSLLKESKSKSATVGMHQDSVTYSSTLLKKTPLVNKYPGPAIKKGATHIDQCDPEGHVSNTGEAEALKPESGLESRETEVTNETTNNVSSGGEKQSDPEGRDFNAEALEPEGGLESRETESEDCSVECRQATTTSQTTEPTTNRRHRGQQGRSNRPNRGKAALFRFLASPRSVVNEVTILEPEDNVAHDSTENQIERSGPSDSSLLHPIDVTGVESVHNRRSVDPPRLLAGNEGEPTINLLSLDDSASSLRQANSKRKTIDPEEINGFLRAPTGSNMNRRKCGGPEELGPRSRHSHKSAETNEEDSRRNDSVMFRYLSEGERVAALELAQRLRKLKTRKRSARNE